LFTRAAGDQIRIDARAAQIVAAIGRPYHIKGHQFALSASIGVSIATGHARDIGELLGMADLALHDAKVGRHGFCCYDSQMRKKLDERQQLENDLRVAIGNSELEVLYQPIVAMDTMRIASAEALLRWNHPRFGTISPADFLPIAEDIRILNSIERWVLTEACRQAALWPPHLTVAVNVSPSSVVGTEIALIVADVLSESGLEPHRLELEVTESAILNDDQDTQRKFRELKALGVSIAMDDFGTGFSSLAYLSKYPFDRIKIDRNFVTDLSDEGRNASIVAATVEMARAFGLRTTAEGIESEQQLRKLRGLGVEYAQGYLFSRPIAAAGLPALLLRELRPLTAPPARIEDRSPAA
jgi:predicted signal transduction protein with EAL and GGDEF domain